VVDVNRLKGSWNEVAALGDQVPLFFYSTLFLNTPEARTLFPVTMAGQRDKLVNALGRIVSNVDRLDDLVPFIQQLGREHRKFQAVAEHYPLVGAALLATLEYFLGPRWTPELAADWTAAYNLVSKVMIEAADNAAQDSPPWWEAEVVAHERRTLDVSVLTVRPTSRLDYLPGQSVSIQAPAHSRTWRFYSPANAPRADGTIDFHIRLIDGGVVSPTLVYATQVGDPVRLAPPVGERLTLDPYNRRDLVLLAGGTGLAPLKALVEQVLHTTRLTAHVFMGGRTSSDLYDLAAFQRMEASTDRLRVYPVVSHETVYGEKGYVADAALKRGPWTDHEIYLCGSAEMVSCSLTALVKAGIPEERLHVDEFGPNAGDKG